MKSLRLESVSASLIEGIAIHDAGGHLLSWNPAAAGITGWSADDAALLFPTVASGPVEVAPGRWIDSRQSVIRRRSTTLTVTAFTDARPLLALRAAYAQLHDLSTTDTLTGLPNRSLAEERLGLSLRLAVRDGRCVGVLVIDLDRFRLVNDSLGTIVGDRVLQAVATRLRATVGEGDTVARLGSDEFMVVMHRVGDSSSVTQMAQALGSALSAVVEVGGTEVWLTASIGVAVSAPAMAEPDLVGRAHTAMARCKEAGGNGHRIAGPGSTATRDRLELSADLHRAVGGRGLAVHYQPQFDTDSGSMVGVEALVRWPHPDRGMIGPDRFLHISYEDGLIVDIDRYVVHEACRQAKAWLDRGRDFGTMAVNISARTMCGDEVVPLVRDALQLSGLPPERLEIEVSEHLMASNSAIAERCLRALRDIGVQVAIDDFGTGYSSLAQLKRFPLDTIKLDRAFVVDIADEPTGPDIAILRSVVTLASDLGLRCVAEGVETAAQRKLLRYLRCHIMQGHLYSPAVPADALELMLADRAPATASALN